MGNEPILEKSWEFGESKDYKYCSMGMQGSRKEMEDRNFAIGEYDTEKEEKLQSSLKGKSLSFFAVFDGHGGLEAPDHCVNSLFSKLILDEESRLRKEEEEEKNIPFSDDESIVQSFKNVDHQFCENNEDSQSGTTVISTFVMSDENEIDCVCCNIGDSRCISYDNGKLTVLSKDHRPSLVQEKKRILDAGGYIEYDRVNGKLALSRAIGDRPFKLNETKKIEEQLVIPIPEIYRYTFERTKKNDGDNNNNNNNNNYNNNNDNNSNNCPSPTSPTSPSSLTLSASTSTSSKSVKLMIESHQFLVLACDGVWDVLSNEEVCNFILERLKEQEEGTYFEKVKERLAPLYERFGLELPNEIRFPEEYISKEKGFLIRSILGELLDFCVLKKQSNDNVSIVLILFN